MKKTVVVTGGDANFFSFIEDTMKSWAGIGLDRMADIGILDLGLTQEQRSLLQAMGCHVCVPEWTLPVPADLRVPHQVGLIARTALRELFPGYTVYLWFDADAWAQTDEFFDAFVEGATLHGAAVVREDGPGYYRNWVYRRWWYGHMVVSYGLIEGIRVAHKPAINIGILALADTAPHWEAWIRHYRAMIVERGIVNLDQHAFNAAVEIEHLPTALLPARYNWICTLSPPVWDDHRKQLCEPDKAFAPLSVVHLAGPDKQRPYAIRSRHGAPQMTPLTFPAITGLRG